MQERRAVAEGSSGIVATGRSSPLRRKLLYKLAGSYAGKRLRGNEAGAHAVLLPGRDTPAVVPGRQVNTESDCLSIARPRPGRQ
jgi:hypothetical protein